MRIKVAIIILLVVGVVLTANLLINDRKLSPVQIEKVTTACLGCHGSIPTYDAAIMIHNKHAALNCSHCHSNNSGLKVADSFHFSLKWLGIGTMLFALTGIITNLLIINRKGRAN
jgi:Zn finger protein HypA/HybF involved in hydrogenase expression